MKKILLASCVALAAASTAAATSPAGGGRFMDATLSAAQEVPRPHAPARAAGTFHAAGSFTCKEGELDCDSKPGKMTWRLTFRNLSGPASAAHLHLGAAGKAGAVAIPLCGPCKSGAHGTLMMTRKVWKAAGARGVYVNVHTAKNPNGEIRGQIKLSAVL